MAFQIEPDESVAKCVRRLARKQMDKALAGLENRGKTRSEAAVHDARKRFKRVRALVRLASDGLGRKRAEREDRRFRDAGRPLSELRDAGVLIEAFEGLIERFSDRAQPEATRVVGELLRHRKRDVCRHVLGDMHTAAHVAVMVKEASRDATRWPIHGNGWTVLHGGLKRIYARGRRSFRRASRAATDERLHEWRKRVKDLWHALEILQPIRPDFTRHLAKQAHALADLLGDDHDLAVLRQILSNATSATHEVDRAAQTMLPLIDDRRAELQREAFASGARALFRATPRLRGPHEDLLAGLASARSRPPALIQPPSRADRRMVVSRSDSKDQRADDKEQNRGNLGKRRFANLSSPISYLLSPISYLLSPIADLLSPIPDGRLAIYLVVKTTIRSTRPPPHQARRLRDHDGRERHQERELPRLVPEREHRRRRADRAPDQRQAEQRTSSGTRRASIRARCLSKA